MAKQKRLTRTKKQMVSSVLQIYPSLHAHSLRSLHGRSVKPIFTKIRSGGAEISPQQETAAPREREFKKEEGVVSDHDSDDDGDGMMMEKVMMGRVMMMMMMMMMMIMTAAGGRYRRGQR